MEETKKCQTTSAKREMEGGPFVASSGATDCTGAADLISFLKQRTKADRHTDTQLQRRIKKV